MLSHICIILGIFCVSFLLFLTILFLGLNSTLAEYNKKSEQLNFINDEIDRAEATLKVLTDKISYSKNRLFEIDKECFEKSLSKKNKK